MKCEMCNLSNEDKRWMLFESDFWSVYLADKQDYVGRCFVLCRNHRETLSQLDPMEWNDLRSVITAVETMLKKELGATMFNWSCLMNDAYKATSPAPHVHFHVRPRYASPISLGNVIFCDGEFAHHYDNLRKDCLDNHSKELLFNRLKAAAANHIR